MNQIPLEIRRSRGWKNPRTTELAVTRCAPYVCTAQKTHMVRSGLIFLRDGRYSHTALQLWCGNVGFLGSSHPKNFLADSLETHPALPPLCETCQLKNKRSVAKRKNKMKKATLGLLAIMTMSASLLGSVEVRTTTERVERSEATTPLLAAREAMNYLKGGYEDVMVFRRDGCWSVSAYHKVDSPVEIINPSPTPSPASQAAARAVQQIIIDPSPTLSPIPAVVLTGTYGNSVVVTSGTAEYLKIASPGTPEFKQLPLENQWKILHYKNTEARSSYFLNYAGPRVQLIDQKTTEDGRLVQEWRCETKLFYMEGAPTSILQWRETYANVVHLKFGTSERHEQVQLIDITLATVTPEQTTTTPEKVVWP